MSLQNNPFFLLDVACWANRHEILEAAEKKEFILDPSICLDAQNSLINIKKRTSAEFEWFNDVTNSDLIKIRNSVENNKPIITDGLISLSRLNATFFNFCLLETRDYFELGYAIIDMDEQYSSLNQTEIIEMINRNRNKARLIDLSEEEFFEELGKIRNRIRLAISEKLSTLEISPYVELNTIIAEKYIAEADYKDGPILNDVIDQYEIRMQSIIDHKVEEIREKISSIRDNEDEKTISQNVDKLIEQVQNWDIYAQPIQLKSLASGLPHQISKDLSYEIRALSLFLNNEKDMPKIALILVNAMQKVFAEIETIREMFKSDSITLEKIIVEQTESKSILYEIEQLQKNFKLSKQFQSVIDLNSFTERIKKLNLKIIKSSLDIKLKRKLRENLCLFARGLSVDLHNEKQQTRDALDIIDMLKIEFFDIPSLNEQLNEDYETLKYQLLYMQSPIGRQNASLTKANSTNSSSSCSAAAKIFSGIIILAFFITIYVIFTAPNRISNFSTKNSSSSFSSNAIKPSKDSISTFLVYLHDEGGSGGASSVTVQKDKPMPTLTRIPKRDGYIFDGYYSGKNGVGIKYYDAKMNSSHDWNQTSGGTLYAYWIKQKEEQSKDQEQKDKSESSAIQNFKIGDVVNIEIVSIFPDTGIYMSGSTTFSNYICSCETVSGDIVWAYLTVLEYKSNFDSTIDTNISTNYAKKQTFPAKRIHGIIKSSESILKGLSSSIGELIIDYSYTD